MAGGPLHPKSVYFVDAGDVYPGVYQGAGTTEDRTEMQFWDNTASATATVHYVFEMPQVLPSGTMKLRILARANASSGTFIVNPAWASVAQGEGPDDATLAAEGNITLTFTAVDNYLESVTTFDAFSGGALADEIIHMDFDIQSSGTVAADVGFIVSLTWE